MAKRGSPEWHENIKAGLKGRTFHTKHGHTSNGVMSPTYKSWASMIARCTNENDHAFPQYGLRGITVAPEWLDFRNFLRDMGERPSRLYSIDRINGKGNYESGNCRWATKQEQRANQSPILKKECWLTDCTRVAANRGMCHYHWREWRLASGFCRDCGKQAIDGQTLCPEHREKNQQRARAHWLKGKEKV